MASSRIVVLVLNYNGSATLEACLQSIQESTYPNIRLVVLDNGSTDGSSDIPRRLGIETLLYGENLGYCVAYNRAFKQFSDEAAYFLLSNADLIVTPPTIERMVKAADEDDTIGFVGPLQRHADTNRVRSAGVRWSCGGLPWHVKGPGQPFDYLEGAFTLVRREVLDKVGGLDENLGLNLEDLDWQTRAAQAGFRSVLEAEAEIFHHPPGRQRVFSGAYYQTRNACMVTMRYCGGGALTKLKARLYAEGMLASLLGRPRGKFIMEGLRDFRRGVKGMRSFDLDEPQRGPR